MFQCNLPLVVAKAVFGFASSVRPIGWQPDLRSNEENMVNFCNLVIRFVIFSSVALIDISDW